MADLYIETILEATDAVTGATIGTVSDAAGISTINLHVKSLTAVVASGLSIKVQYSPTTAGDVWIDSTLTVVPSATIDTLVSGTAVTTLLARRVRIVSTLTTFTSGTIQVSVLGR